MNRHNPQSLVDLLNKQDKAKSLRIRAKIQRLFPKRPYTKKQLRSAPKPTI